MSSPPVAQPAQPKPGSRESSLRSLYDKAITYILTHTFTLEALETSFPTIASYTPQALANLHAQLVGNLEQQLKDHFEVILQERNVPTWLAQLDRVVEEARRRKGEDEGGVVPTALHALPAEELVKARVQPVLSGCEEELDRRFGVLEERVRERFERVEKKGGEVEVLMKRIEGAFERARELGEVGEAVSEGGL
ncbi:hypothetical protein K470DRAFT_241364 [Piedraia hortae CBS 480.64]|uniref:Nnf1-domain-containing protein n=1 Tax=Piedraia hortae CBS 480.64 TaxID=1314780 RepID=A0A6A7C8L1_9PEZI|nr:hypothetical protein K470DRAFT_241364 [Piedraia hortae CBS 480.64]